MATPVLKFDMKVYGLQAALKELNSTERTYRRTVTKRIVKAAGPILKSARKYIPDKPPLSGMARGVLIKGRDKTGWDSNTASAGFTIKTSQAGRKARTVTFNRTIPQLGFAYNQKVHYQATPYNLLVLQQRNAAASIWDHAGRRTNSMFVTNLNSDGEVKYGPEPRAAEPGVADAMPAVEAELYSIVKEVMDKVDRKLQVKGRQP